MKKLLVSLIVVIAIAGGWYFASPLFIDKKVHEEFPAFDTLPTEEEIRAQMEDMTEDEKAEFQEDIMEKAANMPDTFMEEESPAEETTRPADGEVPPEFPLLLAKGTFKDGDGFHKGEGSAAVYELETGKQFLRFENFSVTNGPDLRVILSAHPNPRSESDVKSVAYVEVSKLKGNKGNQNYDLPTDVDIDDYNTVIIYCKPFHVLFSTAALERS